MFKVELKNKIENNKKETTEITIFCTSPKPAFQQLIKKKVRSILLLSGTLSPL